MKTAFWSRRLHKWVGLLIGIQAVLWMLSGLYMTAISIDLIHGDHLAHRDETPISAAALTGSMANLNANFPVITGLRVKRLLGREVYEVRHANGIGLMDAQSGKRLDPLDEKTARALVAELYQGEGELKQIELLTTLPGEVAKRKGPLWRADFDDATGSSLYLSPLSGELVAKRHDYWRLYDFLWMFHIMDYDTRDNINNPLLRIAAVAGTLFAASGLWLLWFSLGRRKTV
jgi:hypothetical protein